MKTTTVKKFYAFIMMSMMFSFNANAQWLSKASHFPTPQQGIQEMIAVDANVVWAMGYDSNDPLSVTTQFTRTTDGGNHWTAGSMTAFPDWILVGIAPVSGTVCYATIFSLDNTIAKIVKTINGGATWTEKLSYDFGVPITFFGDVYFFNANEGLAFGDVSNGYFTIFTTSDGGNNWTRVPQANMPAAIPDVDESSYIFSAEGIGNTFWTVSTAGRVWKTTDKGLHWNAYQTQETLIDYSNLKMRDALHGLWGVHDELYRTDDGAQTFTEVEPSGTWFTNDLAYVPGTAATYVSTGGNDFDGYGAFHGTGSSYSLDDGNTWITIDTAVEHLSLAMINAYTGFTGGLNQNANAKGIFKYNGSALGYSCGNNQTSMCHNGHTICVESGSISNHLSMGDNLGTCSSRLAFDGTTSDNLQFSIYPNPFSNSPTISFFLSQSQNVSMKIFDVSGRLITTLADKVFEAGENELVWNAEEANPGIYFLNLESKEFSQTMKLIVAK
jgi:photosystem II stability/assembly factor-like uncharacterized protein